MRFKQVQGYTYKHTDTHTVKNKHTSTHARVCNVLDNVVVIHLLHDSDLSSQLFKVVALHLARRHAGEPCLGNDLRAHMYVCVYVCMYAWVCQQFMISLQTHNEFQKHSHESLAFILNYPCKKYVYDDLSYLSACSCVGGKHHITT